VPQDDRKRRFELLALPHLDAAYNLARWLAGNPSDAEDIVQDAYLRAYRYLDSFNGGEFRVWLLSIVRNSFLDWVKENRSARLLFQAEPPAETDETMWGERPRDLQLVAGQQARIGAHHLASQTGGQHVATDIADLPAHGQPDGGLAGVLPSLG
jgi:RNA polymerase sigma-70 factor (ECF subfamily)